MNYLIFYISYVIFSFILGNYVFLELVGFLFLFEIIYNFAIRFDLKKDLKKHNLKTYLVYKKNKNDTITVSNAKVQDIVSSYFAWLFFFSFYIMYCLS